MHARMIGIGLAAATALVATAAVAGGGNGTPDRIVACQKAGGYLRVVDSASRCRRGRRSSTWNVRGPPGPRSRRRCQALPAPPDLKVPRVVLDRQGQPGRPAPRETPAPRIAGPFRATGSRARKVNPARQGPAGPRGHQARGSTRSPISTDRRAPSRRGHPGRSTSPRTRVTTSSSSASVGHRRHPRRLRLRRRPRRPAETSSSTRSTTTRSAPTPASWSGSRTSATRRRASTASPSSS